MSILLSGEMEVDGDLKVTGTIQNDSLAQVILLQQQQINSLLLLIADLEFRIANMECLNTGIIPEGYCDCYGNALDLCGVCAGDDMTCTDCANVLNGDSTEDNCGNCDNDISNDCLQDCSGNWGGSAELDACGECGGDAVSEDECDVTDIDGNTYEIVEIGNQNWMAENLKVTHYNNGDEIHAGGQPDWVATTEGAYTWGSNANIYGYLYNWYAVDDNRGICPAGWHVPSDLEFMQLEITLGMDGAAAYDRGWRGGEDDIASILAGNGNLWIDGLLEMSEYFDESGMKVIPAGKKSDNGNYSGEPNSAAYFWTSDEFPYDPPCAWYRYFSYNNTAVHRTDTFINAGMSIRCIQDN